MSFAVGDKMFGGQLFSTELFSGGIERMIAATGFSGRFLEVLGALPPEVLVLLDTAHVWGPPVTLVCFLLFGPLAGANRLLSRNAQAVGGVGGGPLGVLGRFFGFTNRAWFAFSTALAIRQMVLWFAGLAPVKGALLSLGVEIIPARTGPLAAASRARESGVAGRRSLDDSSDGGGEAATRADGDGSVSDSRRSSVSTDPRRVCFASAYGPLADVPTAVDKARASGVVTVADYHEFKERMAGAPERLPALERGGEWTEMMHKRSEGMSYRAWRHVLPYGGTEYLSRTVFDDTTVEEMVDFFGCDDTRASWDRLLFRHRVLERDEKTGAEVVFWERALPVISNRDYVFSRRTWRDGETYWAITKGCAHAATPEQPGLKRVDPYFSSWRMRAVPGPDGRLTASECVLSHFEEQHVNQDVARFAVKCGMWGVVKNMDSGFRKFQRDRAARRRVARAATEEARARRASAGVERATGTRTTERVTDDERRDASGRWCSGVRSGVRAAGGTHPGGVGAVATRVSKTALRFVGNAAAASVAVGALVALERRSRAVARLGPLDREGARRARRAPRRGSSRSRSRGALALDPGEVEAAVGRVLDERFARRVRDLTEVPRDATGTFPRDDETLPRVGLGAVVGAEKDDPRAETSGSSSDANASGRPSSRSTDGDSTALVSDETRVF